MKFTAQLDVDVVALESDDEITCLLTPWGRADGHG